MLAAVAKANRIVTLDIPAPWKRRSWRSSLNAGSRMAATISKLISGGPEELAPACRSRCRAELVTVSADAAASLVRVLAVAESLYRAGITTNHPYHRE
ncbi:hypothetical protein M8494_37185 [Serratia ureilytica]